jgi:hypothetical protein
MMILNILYAVAGILLALFLLSVPVLLFLGALGLFRDMARFFLRDETGGEGREYCAPPPLSGFASLREGQEQIRARQIERECREQARQNELRRCRGWDSGRVTRPDIRDQVSDDSCGGEAVGNFY